MRPPANPHHVRGIVVPVPDWLLGCDVGRSDLYRIIVGVVK